MNEAKYRYWKEIIGIAKNSGIEKEAWCRQNCISIKTFNHYEGIFRRKAARDCGSEVADRIEHWGSDQKATICEIDFSPETLTETDENETTSTFNASWCCKDLDGEAIEDPQGTGDNHGTRITVEKKNCPFVEIPVQEIFGEGNSVTYEVVRQGNGLTAGVGGHEEKNSKTEACLSESGSVVISETASQADDEDKAGTYFSGGLECSREETDKLVETKEKDSDPHRVEIKIRECRLTVGEDIDEDVLWKIMKVVMPDA